MTTWTTYLARIRRELNDTGSSPRWSDTELLDYTNDGLMDWSLYFPLEKESSIASVSDQREYALPTDILYPAKDSVVRVEHPTGTYLVISWLKSGSVTGTLSELATVGRVTSGGYALVILFKDKLILTQDPDTGYPIKVWYLARHTLLTAGTDSLTIPAQDEAALMWFVTSKAYARISGEDARLARWEEGSSRNTDRGPLIPEHQWRYERYLEAVQARKKPEHKRLVVRRRRRR